MESTWVKRSRWHAPRRTRSSAFAECICSSPLVIMTATNLKWMGVVYEAGAAARPLVLIAQ
eukprot:scaffold102757_cov36-Tisochrysis_lutea.AAC.2